MAWVPRYNALNLGAIPANLIAFWLANQADAFAWLGQPALPLLKEFAATEENLGVPVYPAVHFVSDVDAVDYSGDNIQGAYLMRFEIMVTNPDGGVATARANAYKLALLSMLLNCPLATLTAGAGTLVSDTVVESTSAELLEILANDEQTEFLQRVSLQATLKVYASIFA